MPRNTSSTDDMIAAFLAKRGVTRIAEGASALAQRLDVRNTPQDTRRKGFYADAPRGQFCEDAPCCGCCTRDAFR